MGRNFLESRIFWTLDKKRSRHDVGFLCSSADCIPLHLFNSRQEHLNDLHSHLDASNAEEMTLGSDNLLGSYPGYHHIFIICIMQLITWGLSVATTFLLAWLFFVVLKCMYQPFSCAVIVMSPTQYMVNDVLGGSWRVVHWVSTRSKGSIVLREEPTRGDHTTLYEVNLSSILQ